MHLTERNIQELTYAYVKKIQLSDSQVRFKRHMADCDDCFNRFLVEKELQETLIGAGLLTESVMDEILAEEKEASENILLRMKKAADGLRLFIEEVRDKTESLWNFYPTPHVAFSRGESEEEESMVYESVLSEYSTIQVSREGLLVRLDEADYPAERYVLRVIRDGSEERIPFHYNEDEESYDAFVKGEIEPDTQLEIVEAADED